MVKLCRFFFIYFIIFTDLFAAASSGHVELLESLLLLCAEMDDGLGLLVTTRPHGKTAAQLLPRVMNAAILWCRAAENGHVRMLQWLCDNASIELYHRQEATRCAARGGHTEALNWLWRQRGYVVVLFAVSLIFRSRIFVFLDLSRHLMILYVAWPPRTDILMR